MKKILFVLLSIIFVIIFFFTRNYYYKNRVVNQRIYILYGYDKNNVPLKKEMGDYYQARILHELLSGYYTWDQLPVTEKFKGKFKNRKNILNEIDQIEYISVRVDDTSEDNILVLSADKKQNFIEEKLFPCETVEEFFKFKMDGDKLDDLELIKKQIVHTPTREVLKVIKQGNLE